MKVFEKVYSLMRSYLLTIHRLAQEDIKEIVEKNFKNRPQILDVGGRKSHYTIGLKGDITISDLPRLSDIQKKLHLGINDDIAIKTKKRRSNINDIVYDDMTHSNFADNSFDIIIAIEVLEHVPEDDKFVSEVYRVLKPGGYFYMTTPNGEVYPIPSNPDHIRHYKRIELQNLLGKKFIRPNVRFGVYLSKYRKAGLASLSAKNPFKTLRAMKGNFINYKESILPGVDQMAGKTNHLIAVCKK
jgi:SAM-dependent methyltransferase